MKLKKFKSILTCVLVLCMTFGIQSNLAFVFAQGNDDTIEQENIVDNMVDITDDTARTTTDEVDVNTEAEKKDENIGDSQHTKYGLTDEEEWEECNQCSKDNPHLIATTADLDKVRTHTHTEGNVTTITGYFKLVNDIVFTDEDYQENGAFYNNGWGWTPIGHNNKTSYFSGDQFQGDFNGDDYAVKNIKIERPAGYWYNGLFAGPGDNAHIYNLKLEGFAIHADGAGALYGQSYATKKDSMLVENITVYNSCITGISSAAKLSGIFAGAIKGINRNITISNSTYKFGKSAWKGGFIASEIATGKLENVTVTDCEMTTYAYTGILVPTICLDAVIKGVVIKDSTVNTTHHAWSYLIYEDFRSNLTGPTPVISDVKIDVNIQGTTAHLKDAKTIIPKLKNSDDSAIQMDNIDVHAILTDKTTNSQSKVDFNVDTNVIGIPSDAEKNIKAEERYIVSLNGGHIRPETVNEEGKLIADRSGYAFDGWYENKELNGDSIEKLNYNTYYYAKWSEKADCEVSFKDNLKLDKIYDENAVSLLESDYIVTEGAGKVTFNYQMKEDNEWKDIDTTPINAGTYRVKAIVAENDTHKRAETDWKEFVISKAMPTYEVPTNLTAIVGQTLADVTLPQDFAWQDDTTTSVGSAGINTFKVTYTPKDTANYNNITDIEVILTVNPKMEELNAIPTINASNKTLTVGDTFEALDAVTASDKEDGDITEKVEVLSNDVDTSKAGTYTVIYKVTDSKGASSTKIITVTVNPKMEELNAIPTINASDKTLTVGDTFEALDCVTASDKEDGDITKKVEVLSNNVDTSKAGTYTVIYKVTDSKGASSTKTITVTVKAKDTQNPTTDDNKKPSATDTDKKPASIDKNMTADNPKTGDSSNVTTWLALMFVSFGLLAGISVRKSRKNR
ncbi:immunoglobulin-like domain-containing protein [Thomasclavelia ramosa]|uniref:immunoglobulin-like domain-containing protein n=1 Tax=Thomasclavelia ramosa TaxID=1547 RepID=UPI0002430E04|nr:LPXTG-domain-containing protein cell wall anchor domain [Coprobacillus sp. D7]EHM88757.1 LPXTG-domain-containing protein cell wall anchor domain [Coprobacillus sp. 3_3_56FAA]